MLCFGHTIAFFINLPILPSPLPCQEHRALPNLSPTSWLLFPSCPSQGGVPAGSWVLPSLLFQLQTLTVLTHLHAGSAIELGSFWGRGQLAGSTAGGPGPRRGLGGALLIKAARTALWYHKTGLTLSAPKPHDKTAGPKSRAEPGWVEAHRPAAALHRQAQCGQEEVRLFSSSPARGH